MTEYDRPQRHRKSERPHRARRNNDREPVMRIRRFLRTQVHNARVTIHDAELWLEVRMKGRNRKTKKQRGRTSKKGNW